MVKNSCNLRKRNWRRKNRAAIAAAGGGATERAPHAIKSYRALIEAFKVFDRDGNGFIMSQEIIVQNAGTESNFGNYGGLYAYNKPVKGKGSSTFKGVTIEKDSGGSNIFDNQWIYSVSYTSGSSTSETTKNGGRIKQYFLSITADGLVQDSGVWGGCDTNPFADAY